jgi:ribosomal protein S18 acetylase RimI-like enzyme
MSRTRSDTTLLLRDYRPGDAAAVRRLVAQLQRHLHRLEPAHDRGAPIAPRYFRAMMRAARSGGVTVAERDGRVVGFAAYSIEDTFEHIDTVPARFLYISDLCVDERARRGGIARALVDEVHRFARRRRLKEVRLNVLSANQEARATYRACGYRDYLVSMIARA